MPDDALEKQKEKKVVLHAYGDVPLLVLPSDHGVSDPCRGPGLSRPQGFKIIFNNFAFIGLAFLVHYILFYYYHPQPPIRYIVGAVLFMIAAGCVLASLDGFRLAFEKPDQKSPEKALEWFLLYAKNKIHEQAFSLLTDQGRAFGKANLPNTTLWAREMPPVEIFDLESFASFWDKIPFAFDRKKQFRRHRIDDRTVVLEAPVIFRHATQKDPLIVDNRFLFLKRNDKWYLANGFIWPFQVE